MRRLSACVLLCSSLLLVLCSCGSSVSSGSGSSSTTSTTTTTNAYAAAYEKATFATGVSAAFSGSCTMTVSASGTPYQHQSYYLAPVGTGGTVVATTPSGIQLQVVPYTMLSTDTAVSATFNICPTLAKTTTPTGGGPIGVIFSGTYLFDPYEATTTVALGDNATYTFTANGTSYTAGFLDPCNQHPAGMNGRSTWHYHGNPNCWTSVVDGATGASHIIGIALDGFPIYGGRDINGNIVAASTLDACNGITSPTPEFPTGAYHYVLPLTSTGASVTTVQSSIGCYSGAVDATVAANMQRLACRAPMLLANGKARLPDGREVSRGEAARWLQQMQGSMPGMTVASRAGEVEQGSANRT